MTDATCLRSHAHLSPCLPPRDTVRRCTHTVPVTRGVLLANPCRAQAPFGRLYWGPCWPWRRRRGTAAAAVVVAAVAMSTEPWLVVAVVAVVSAEWCRRWSRRESRWRPSFLRRAQAAGLGAELRTFSRFCLALFRHYLEFAKLGKGRVLKTGLSWCLGGRFWRAHAAGLGAELRNCLVLALHLLCLEFAKLGQGSVLNTGHRLIELCEVVFNCRLLLGASIVDDGCCWIDDRDGKRDRNKGENHDGSHWQTAHLPRL